MEHIWSSIPGWATFWPLYKMAVENAPDEAHFCEIGSWLGKSATYMAVEIANSGKRIQFDCVDPWEDGGPDLKHKAHLFPEPLYDMFLNNIEPVKEYINPIRKPSLSAARSYKKASLDFVMIDGSHVYEDVKADIKAWLPKIKPGGIIALDDVNWNGPRTAMKELLPMSKVVIHEAPQPKGSTKGPARYAHYVVE